MPSLGSLLPKRSRVISHRRLNLILQSITQTLTAEIVDATRHRRVATPGHDEIRTIGGEYQWGEFPPGVEPE